MYGGYYNAHGNNLILNLEYHDIKIPIYCKHANIPVIIYFSVSSKERESFGPQLWSVLDHYDLIKLDYLDI